MPENKKTKTDHELEQCLRVWCAVFYGAAPQIDGEACVQWWNEGRSLIHTHTHTQIESVIKVAMMGAQPETYSKRHHEWKSLFHLKHATRSAKGFSKSTSVGSLVAHIVRAPRGAANGSAPKTTARVKAGKYEVRQARNKQLQFLRALFAYTT